LHLENLPNYFLIALAYKKRSQVHRLLVS